MFDLMSKNDIDRELKAAQQSRQRFEEMLSNSQIDSFINRLKDEILTELQGKLGDKIAENGEVMNIAISFFMQQTQSTKDEFLKYVKELNSPYQPGDTRSKHFIQAKIWLRVNFNDPELKAK